MSSSSNFGRFLGTINGQPIIIKDDMSLNTITGFGSDILQQAIEDVPSTETITPDVSCISNIVLDPDQNVSVLNDGPGRSEFIAVLSNDANSEDTSTIRLTLEQAAQLGIHFTMDTSEQSIISSTVNKDIVDNSTNQSQFISQKTNQSVQSSDASSLNSEITCSLTEDVTMLDKSRPSENNTFLENFQPETSHNQQLTLVPHILNGEVTYTLQLTDESLTSLSNNELFRLNESPVINQASNSVESELKIDMGNLSASSELPFINSPVDIITNKGVADPNQGINETNNSDQTYGIVSCNSENVTFLNLADTIPVGTNISNIVSHINNVSNKKNPHQPKLASMLRRSNDTLKQKVFLNQGGESLLKHRNVPLLKNGVNNHSQSVMGNGKSIEKVIFNNQLTSLASKSVANEHSNNSSDVFINQKERNGCPESENTKAHSEISHKPDINFSKGDLTPLEEDRNGDKHSGSSNNLRQTPTIITPSGGDVPREVSVALSRIPIKTDSNKPLGSNENPIQLVQQGTTFHSMQALTDDHISKIKPILQGNFDPKIPSKNVVYDPASNTRIIYRIISPAEVSLRKQDDFPKRRGRPKKVRLTDNQSEDLVDGAPQPKKAFPRTRSGRLSRPPKHMVRDYKHLRRAEIDDSDGAYSDYQSEQEDPAAPPESAPVELLPGLVAKRKSHKRNISAGNLCPTCGKIYLGYVRMKRHFDKYPDHGSIEYLNTIRNSNPDSEGENQRVDGGNGLWKKGGKRRGKGRYHFSSADKRTRLKEALGWCSSEEVAEVAGPAVASVLSLWQLLLLRVDAVKADSRVAALYNEMCQLVHKLRTVAHQLFRPLDHPTPPATKHTTVQVEDDIMTGILNLPHGIYLASDEDLVETPAAPVQENNDSAVEPQIFQEKLEEEDVDDVVDEDQKSKTDIDEVPQSFLLTNEEMICDPDERGLVNVDEIVSERLQNFTGSQASTVDELMKGLNEMEHRNKLETDDLMDGFSIVSRRTHVSASTEDLMKSLEHFESDLNHTDAPTALDRDTFDRVTNVDTLDFEVLSREFHSNNR